jgi:hypothetical protein
VCPCGGFAQQELFKRIHDIFDEMKPVCHLKCLGCADLGPFSIRTPAIPADDFNAWVVFEPGREGVSCPIWEKVYGTVRLQIHNQRPIGFSLAPSPIVHADLARGRRRRDDCRPHGAQETHATRPTAWKPLSLCQSLGRPPTEREPQAFQCLMKRGGMALMGCSDLGDLLAESAAWTATIATEEPPPTETEHDSPSVPGKIHEGAEKVAMDTPGPVMTDWTTGTRGGRRHFEDQLPQPDLADVYLDPGEMREYSREELKMVAHGSTPEITGSGNTTSNAAQCSPNTLYLLTVSVPEPRINDEVSCKQTCFRCIAPLVADVVRYTAGNPWLLIRHSAT